MCGIAGWQGNFDTNLLDAMTASIAHRGPDGHDKVVITVAGMAPTGLGHRRLAIIDLSNAGIQPMKVTPDAAGGMQSELTLVFNGEIYNYRELRAELVAAGHNFRTATDSEVLLHLYERDGLRMVEHLNGIFAFAIHDGRLNGRPEGVERGALFIARDHLGVKPLYFAQTKSGFLFGSEIKALLCYRELSREIDPAALHQMLAYLWTPAPRTMLASVRKLEPGAALIVHDGQIRKHWSFFTIPYNGVTDRRSSEAISLELAERTAIAVQRQLVSDVPVGAYLSGGLDSSAIVAMMRKANPQQQIDCFCIGFKDGIDTDGSPPDLPYAREVARHVGVDLHEILMDHSSIDRLDEMVWLLDEPQADPAPINALLVAERARAMNIPVLLSGAGGDDLFSGYRRHWALSFERNWAWLPRAVRCGIQSMATGNRGSSQSTASRRLMKMFAHAGDDPERRLVSYFWWSSEQLRRSLYSDAFADQVRTEDAAAPLLASLTSIPQEHNRLQQMLFLESRYFLPDHNLNYTDRAGMAVGVEVRVPLLDLDLVRFATRIPAHLKQRGRVGKSIFKQAMEPYLPREVIYRPKTGFGAPLRRWLHNELRPQVEATLDPVSLRQRGFFNPDAVQRLLQLDRAGAVDGSYTLFALMCFELWCRRFVDAS